MPFLKCFILFPESADRVCLPMHDKCKGLHKEGTVYSATVKFQNKPRGLYFSKALFEGLIFGGGIFEGAYLRREICISKPIGLAL